MRKKLLIIAIIAVSVLIAFAACGGNNETGKPQETENADSTNVPVYTKEPTASPEPTEAPTPTPVPEPGTYDLFAETGIGDPMTADADGLICGDTWPDNTGRTDICWCGILGAGYDASDPDAEPSSREVVAATLSNGEEGYVLRFANDGVGTGYVGAGNYITNVNDLLEHGHTYKLTVTLKATHSTQVADGTMESEIRDYWIYSNTDILSPAENGVKVEATGEWQTVEYVFTTKDIYDSDNGLVNGVANFTICCDPFSPFMFQGFEVLIERATLYELVEA